MATAWARVRAPSLSWIRVTCVVTVRGAISSWSAIAELWCPCAMSRSTSRSRSVSGQRIKERRLRSGGHYFHYRSSRARAATGRATFFSARLECLRYGCSTPAVRRAWTCDSIGACRPIRCLRPSMRRSNPLSATCNGAEASVSQCL